MTKSVSEGRVQTWGQQADGIWTLQPRLCWIHHTEETSRYILHVLTCVLFQFQCSDSLWLPQMTSWGRRPKTIGVGEETLFPLQAEPTLHTLATWNSWPPESVKDEGRAAEALHLFYVGGAPSCGPGTARDKYAAGSQGQVTKCLCVRGGEWGFQRWLHFRRQWRDEVWSQVVRAVVAVCDWSLEWAFWAAVSLSACVVEV